MLSQTDTSFRLMQLRDTARYFPLRPRRHFRFATTVKPTREHASERSYSYEKDRTVSIFAVRDSRRVRHRS